MSAVIADIRPVQNSDRMKSYFGGTLFIILGCVILFFFFIKPTMTRLAAKNWPQVQAVVEDSRVITQHGRSSHGGESITYSFNVLYRYSFGGEQYHSNNYNGMGSVGSSDYSFAESLTRQYPAGANITVRVDPKSPSYAIINYDMDAWSYISLLFAIFPLVGIYLIKDASAAQYMIELPYEYIDRRGFARMGRRTTFFKTMDEAQSYLVKRGMRLQSQPGNQSL